MIEAAAGKAGSANGAIWPKIAMGKNKKWLRNLGAIGWKVAQVGSDPLVGASNEAAGDIAVSNRYSALAISQRSMVSQQAAEQGGGRRESEGGGCGHIDVPYAGQRMSVVLTIYVYQIPRQ